MQRLYLYSRLYKQMEQTTEKLIESCRRGNKSAQLALYNKYARKLYITCLRIVGNTVEAEEAMQDSFLKIFTRLDQFKDGQNFEAWMHRVALHTAIDYVRRQSYLFEELSENFPEAEAEELNEDDIRYPVDPVKKATTLLPPGYRSVLSLYLFEGYDMEEIASILKIQPHSVRTQYLRAKRKLLEVMSVN